VEVEKRDVKEEVSDCGSNSNPSEDNFELDEMYEDLYLLSK